jgi:hypothetical protein
MKRQWICLVFLTLLIGCGGGSGTEKSPQFWEGNLNPAGFPDVEGDYIFRTGLISYTCGSDPLVRKLSGFTMPLQLSQLEDQLLAWNDAADSDPDITIIDADTLAGEVELDGHFTMNQTVVYSVADEAGQFTVHHELLGLFNPSGWAGDYRYTTYHDDAEETCKFSARFSGERVTSELRAAVHAEPAIATTEESDPAGKLLGHLR